MLAPYARNGLELHVFRFMTIAYLQFSLQDIKWMSYAISLYPSNNQESTAWLLIYDTNDRHNANWQIRRMVANENATTSFIEYRHLSV